MLSFTARPAATDGNTGRVTVVEAWSNDEVKAGVAELLTLWEHRLPADKATGIVIKPN